MKFEPFGLGSDGTLPGEGAVALVLRRLDDALARNERVLAVIEASPKSLTRRSGRASNRPLHRACDAGCD